LIDWHRPAAQASFGAESAVAPVSLEDATDGGLLERGPRCWQRELPVLRRQQDRLVGLGFHSTERLEACVFARPGNDGWEILTAGFAPSELGRMGLRVLLEEVERRAGGAGLLLSRVAPEEIDFALLADLGFRPGAEHVLFATEAQAA
jgi:hypothetical protein